MSDWLEVEAPHSTRKEGTLHLATLFRGPVFHTWEGGQTSVACPRKRLPIFLGHTTYPPLVHNLMPEGAGRDSRHRRGKHHAENMPLSSPMLRKDQ